MVTGMSGEYRDNGGLASFGYECRPLNVVGSPGNWSFAIDDQVAPTIFGPYVGANGDGDYSYSCPDSHDSNYVATGLGGTYDNSVDQIRLDCSPVNVLTP